MDEPSPSHIAELEEWLLVSQSTGIGSRYFQQLIGHFGSPGKVLSASRTELADLGLPRAAIDNLKRRKAADIEPTLTWLRQPGHRLLTLDDENYPDLLREINGPPPLLYLIGDAGLLTQPQLAIVGSRNPTPTGLGNAREFARSLTRMGLCVTSGLAIGIDGAAHTGALEAGSTIAVMGTGPDRIYPASHRELAHHIAERGLLVSEFPPGTQARAENFPRRNRLISGLSLGTLVIEAAVQSGSLITARLATEQGREVFAIPGSIHNPQARGCHALIRQGAKLVESAQDILEELGPLLASMIPVTCDPHSETETTRPRFTDPVYHRLIDAIGYDPATVDELITRTGLTADAVSSMLLVLELDGHVSSAPGGIYCRTDIPASRSSGRERT